MSPGRSYYFFFYILFGTGKGGVLMSIFITWDLRGGLEGLIAWHNWRSIHDGGCAWHQTS